MKARLQKIMKFIQKHLHADDHEISVYYRDSQDTRFAQNSITQHMAGDSIGVFYNCIVDRRTGSAHTKQIDEANLLNIIKKAEENARENMPDPDIASTLSKAEYPQVQNYASSIKKLTTKKMVDIVKTCILNAKLKNAQLSGIISKSTNENLFVTGQGFSGYTYGSEVDLSMTLRANHIETKVAYSHKDFDKLHIDDIINQLNEQFAALHTLKDMDFETLPVILRPQAVMELFSYLWWIYNRKTADEGLTPFTAQIGKKFLGEHFSLLSTIDDPDLKTQPFNNICVAKSMNWVTNGVINDMPTPRDWAHKHNLTPSYMHNMVIPGQGISETEMMKKVKRGLIINNLWYIRINDMKAADLTGMTRDGVLYFENGTVKHAVNNFRFNECLPEMTRRILATGKPIQIRSNSKVPAMLIEDFHFVDKTTF